MNYGVAIFPSKTIQDQVNPLRKRYDPRYSLIPPHLTLKESFVAEEDTLNEIVDELQKIAKETEPFYINIKKVSTFEPVTNTIYLKVEPIQQLNDLHTKLHEGKFENNQTHPFVPHITIAQDLEHDEFKDVLGRLKMEGFNLEDYVDRFQLLYQLDNESWTVHQTFVLGRN